MTAKPFRRKLVMFRKTKRDSARPFIRFSDDAKDFWVDCDGVGNVRRVTIDVGTSGSVTVDADGLRTWIDTATN